MPARYGHYSTAFRRLKKWMELGVWERILDALISKGYYMGKLSIDRVAIDSANIKAGKVGGIRWI